MNPTSTTVETHQEQLERLEAEVETLRAQLEGTRKLATVGTMAAMVAHEFNNILTPIISYAQMARRNPRLVEKALSRATEGGARAASICRALLDLTRTGDDRPQPVRLAELIDKTLEAMARKPGKDAIELKLVVPDGLEVTTRRAELQQVLLNLLINAREAVLAGPNPRWITISAERNDTDVLIRVADGGAGIHPENLDRIFQPFFTTKDLLDEDRKSYGLGLAFCRDVMSALGGDISVESAPQEGAAFTVRLPG